MSITYTYSADWIGRDTQPDNSPLRVIKAADFLTEWQAIQTAFASAAPLANPVFTGTVTAGSFVGSDVQTSTLNGEAANPAEWNTAYSWGDHGTEGYLVATATDKANWNTAYGWGNHATQGYLTSFTETDPTVPSHVKSINPSDISDWNEAHGWGDHASEGYLTTETDPTVPAHVKGILLVEKNNWNTAYGWGDHGVEGYLKSVNFSDINGSSVITSSETWGGSSDVALPTVAAVEERLTTGGFISDYNVTEADVTQYQAAINAGVSITENQVTDLGDYIEDAVSDGTQYVRQNGAWVAVSGATGGTVTSVDATTPTGLTVSGGPITGNGTLAFGLQSGYSIPTTSKQSNWDTAYGWGNHASEGYLTSEADPTVPSHVKTISTDDIGDWNEAHAWGNHSSAGYLTTESDPTVPSYVKNITSTEKNNWNTAHGWGNHANAGYITTEADPTVPSHVKTISTTDKSNWNTAYGWGDHASEGYALDSAVPSNTGAGASGTWGINITGSAGSAGSATTATTATNCSRSVTGTGNLSGGGTLDANRSITLNSTLMGMVDVQTSNLSIGSWDIKLDGSDLRFVYNGTDVFRITTAGAIIAKNNVTAYGSP